MFSELFPLTPRALLVINNFMLHPVRFKNHATTWPAVNRRQGPRTSCKWLQSTFVATEIRENPKRVQWCSGDSTDPNMRSYLALEGRQFQFRWAYNGNGGGVERERGRKERTKTRQGRDTGVCVLGRWEDTVTIKDTFIIDTSNGASVFTWSYIYKFMVIMETHLKAAHEITWSEQIQMFARMWGVGREARPL